MDTPFNDDWLCSDCHICNPPENVKLTKVKYTYIPEKSRTATFLETVVYASAIVALVGISALAGYGIYYWVQITFS
jgi:hypothetical protein